MSSTESYKNPATLVVVTQIHASRRGLSLWSRAAQVDLQAKDFTVHADYRDNTLWFHIKDRSSEARGYLYFDRGEWRGQPNVRHLPHARADLIHRDVLGWLRQRGGEVLEKARAEHQLRQRFNAAGLPYTAMDRQLLVLLTEAWEHSPRMACLFGSSAEQLSALTLQREALSEREASLRAREDSVRRREMAVDAMLLESVTEEIERLRVQRAHVACDEQRGELTRRIERLTSAQRVTSH